MTILWNPLYGGGGYGGNGLDSGLANFYALDETSGSCVNTERSLVLAEVGGSVGRGTGIRSGTSCISLSHASTARLKTATSSAIFDGNPFTISFWMKFRNQPVEGSDPNGFWYTFTANDGTGVQMMSVDVFNEYNGAGIKFIEHYCYGTNTASIKHTTGQDLDFSVYVDVWTHVCFGHDGTSTFFYQRNGGARSTVSQVNSLPSVINAFFGIGDVYSSGTYNPDADFQFLGHWNRALTANEVAILYNAGQGLTREEMT